MLPTNPFLSTGWQAFCHGSSTIITLYLVPLQLSLFVDLPSSIMLVVYSLEFYLYLSSPLPLGLAHSTLCSISFPPRIHLVLFLWMSVLSDLQCMKDTFVLYLFHNSILVIRYGFCICLLLFCLVAAIAFVLLNVHQLVLMLYSFWIVGLNSKFWIASHKLDILSYYILLFFQCINCKKCVHKESLGAHALPGHIIQNMMYNPLIYISNYNYISLSKLKFKIFFAI